jgi:hypothetical protein
MEFSAKREIKSDGKFPIKKFQSANFERVGRVRGNKLIFNFGLRSNKEKSENNSDSPLDKLCLAELRILDSFRQKIDIFALPSTSLS